MIQWFFEDRESGRNLDRPKFKEPQTLIFQGKIKTVVVWKLDRLARNLREGVNVLADWCHRNVGIVSIFQPLGKKREGEFLWLVV